MFSFENTVIDATIKKLLNGEDYRQEIINDVNFKFFDFTLEFFKKLVDAKINLQKIDSDWYKKYFLSAENFDKSEISIFSGINLKTVNNIYCTTKKEIVIDVAEQNYIYLKNLIQQLGIDSTSKLNAQLEITKNGISIDLDLSESLIVLNALATKKNSLRGGAWSAIGKKIEKPLLVKLCNLCGVPEKNYNIKGSVKDKNKLVDREVDFRFYGKSGEKYFCEVKLMGIGNPEARGCSNCKKFKNFYC